MLLFLFLCATVFIHLSLQYVVIPRLEVNNKPLTRSALLAASKYLSTTALIASVMYLLILLLMFVLSWTQPVTSAELGAAIARIQAFQSRFKLFREFWIIWLFVMLFLAYLACRRAPVADKEKVPEELPYLPPNEEMEAITRRIDELAQKAKRVEQGWVGTDVELHVRLSEFKQESAWRKHQLHEADLRRRAAPPSDVETLPFHSKVRRFVGSQGFFNTLKATTRSLGYIGTVLLALSVIGVSVPVLDGELRSRAVHLSELQVELSKDEARKSFERVMSEEKDPQTQPLSAEDERVIEETAHLVEEFFTSSSDLQTEKDDDDKKHVAFVMRSQVVRDQIVNDFKLQTVSENFRGNPGGPEQGPGGPSTDGPPPDRPPEPNSGSPNKRRDGPPEPGTGGRGLDRTPKSGGGGRPADMGGGRANGVTGNESERPKPPPPTPKTNTDLRTQLARNDGGPQSAFGEQVADSLRQGLTGRPRLLDKLKAKLRAYKASFSEPVAPLDLGKFAFAEAVGAAIDNSWQPQNQAVGQLPKIGRAAFKDVAANVFARAQRSDRGAFQKAVKRMYQTVMSRFFSDLAGGDSLGDALGHVRDGLPQQPVLTQQETAALREVAVELPRQETLFTELQDAYKNAPPALAYNQTELLENEQQAERLRSRGVQKISSEDLKTVDSYEDHYPGRFGAEADTPKGKLLAAAPSSDRLPNDSEKLLAQARDFSSLQKSVDVGGILMGRSPDSASGDFRGLRWTTDNESITLFVRRADGTEIVAGPFEKSLVHQALAYVADGRKVVVTIIGGGKGARKVMLHPAFVDTRLGRDIIEFDKLVFRFVTNCEPRRAQWDKLIDAQVQMYDVALGLRQLSALRQWDEEGVLKSEGQDRLNKLASWEARIFSEPKIYELFRPVLQDAEGLKRPERSVLAWGQAFYDQALVGSLSDCAADSRSDLDAFHTCLTSRLAEDARSASVDTMKEWFQPPPDLAWRSIAEELPYQADNNLSFINHENSSNPAEKLWPFQFRYEIAFPATTPDGATTGAGDAYRAPWEFRELRDLVANRVWAGVEANQDLRPLYKRVRDFTVLQRLFRASLEGNLGTRYPVEKLALLMRVTDSSVAPLNTPRWDDARPDKCR